jgi:hypothetical protein
VHQHRLRHSAAKRLGSPEVDDQLEGRRLLDRQIGGLGTFEDTNGRLPPQRLFMSLLIGESSVKERQGAPWVLSTITPQCLGGHSWPFGPRGCPGYLRLRQTTANGKRSFHYRITREGVCLPSAGREGQTWRCEGWMVKLNDPQVPQSCRGMPFAGATH